MVVMVLVFVLKVEKIQVSRIFFIYSFYILWEFSGCYKIYSKIIDFVVFMTIFLLLSFFRPLNKNIYTNIFRDDEWWQLTIRMRGRKNRVYTFSHFTVGRWGQKFNFFSCESFFRIVSIKCMLRRVIKEHEEKFNWLTAIRIL